MTEGAKGRKIGRRRPVDFERLAEKGAEAAAADARPSRGEDNPGAGPGLAADR